MLQQGTEMPDHKKRKKRQPKPTRQPQEIVREGLGPLLDNPLFTKAASDITINTPAPELGPFLQQRRDAYTPRLSEVLFNNVPSYGYGVDQIPNLLKAAGSLLTPGTQRQEPAKAQRYVQEGKVAPGRAVDTAVSEDAWAVYLGLPQQNNTLDVSSFRPTRGKGENTSYFKIKDFWNNLAFLDIYNSENSTEHPFTTLLDFVEYQETRPANKRLAPENVPLGRFKYSRGQDRQGHYISYYDLWDLAPEISGVLGTVVKKGAGIVGKPMEFYDRLYYDPKTRLPLERQPVPTSEVLARLFSFSGQQP